MVSGGEWVVGVIRNVVGIRIYHPPSRRLLPAVAYVAVACVACVACRLSSSSVQLMPSALMCLLYASAHLSMLDARSD